MKGITTWILILCCVGLRALPLHGSIDSDDGIDDSASTPVGNKSRAICSNLFTQLADKYQSALVAISEQRVEAALEIIQHHPFTDDQKLLLWRLFVQVSPETARTSIAKFGFQGEMLESILTEIISVHPAYVMENFAALAPRQEDKVRIAKLLAERTKIGPLMPSLGIESEAARAELAMITIGAHKDDFQHNFENFELQDPSLRVMVLAALVMKEDYKDGYYVGSFAELQAQASVESRYELAKSLVNARFIAQDDSSIPGVAAWAQGFSEEQKTELATIWYGKRIGEYGWARPPHSTQDLNILFNLSPASRAKSITTLLENIPRAQLRDRAARDLFLFNWFGGRLNSLIAVAPQIRRAIFKRDGMQLIAETNHVDSLDQLNLVEEGDTLDLTRALKTFAQENPDMLPERFIGLLWEDVRNRDVAVTLLREYLSQRQGDFSNPPSSSLELLSVVTGLSMESIAASRDLRRNPTELYELALNIQDKLAKPAFSYLPIAPEVYLRKSEFLSVLRVLRDLHEQNGDGTKGWKKTLKSLGLSEDQGLTTDNLDSVITQAKEQLIEAVREKLQAQNINFSYDDFISLERQWGDLEPIWTLLSRFQGNAVWHTEIPYLIDVFDSVLHGTFEHKKFHGGFNQPNDVVQAGYQLRGMNSAQIDEWKKPRATASVPGLSAETARAAAQLAEARLAEARMSVQNHFIPHLIDSGFRSPAPQSSALSAEKAQFYESTYLPEMTVLMRQEPHAIVDRLLEKFTECCSVSEYADPGRQFFEFVSRQLETASSLDFIKAQFRVMNSLLTFHPEFTAHARTPEIKASIREIEKLLKVEPKNTASEIIFSALNSDPKLLLMIGDVVQVASCQNYKTGGHIESLLAYVADANIRAMVSFSLKMQQFASPDDFHSVVEAIATDRATSQFDGNKRIVTFRISLPEGVKEIRTLPLGNGYLRRMVKYGLTQSARPGVKFEKDYAQAHPHFTLMQQQQEAMLEELKAGIGAQDQSGSVTIYRSRNPGGVYSDMARGFKVNQDYVIP